MCCSLKHAYKHTQPACINMCYCMGACFLLHTHTLKSQGTLICAAVKLNILLSVNVLKIHEKNSLLLLSRWFPLTSLPHSLSLSATISHAHCHNQSSSSPLSYMCGAYTHTRVLPSTSWKTEGRRESERWEKKVIIFRVILPSDLCPPFCQPPTGSWK